MLTLVAIGLLAGAMAQRRSVYLARAEIFQQSAAEIERTMDALRAELDELNRTYELLRGKTATDRAKLDRIRLERESKNLELQELGVVLVRAEGLARRCRDAAVRPWEPRDAELDQFIPQRPLAPVPQSAPRFPDVSIEVSPTPLARPVERGPAAGAASRAIEP
jgi:hypothetical protein